MTREELNVLNAVALVKIAGDALERMLVLEAILKQCVFEGLTHHGNPRLIPSERLTMALMRGRHYLQAIQGKPIPENPSEG